LKYGCPSGGTVKYGVPPNRVLQLEDDDGKNNCVAMYAVPPDKISADPQKCVVKYGIPVVKYGVPTS
jgi:hypothetical protein